MAQDLGSDAREAETATAKGRRTSGGARLGGHVRGLKLDQILGAVAAIIIPAGVAAILLGWYGAARTPFAFEQTPYLISGGLLGVGLLAGGGLLYIGTWVARLAEQNREEAQRIRALLAEIRDGLQRPPVAGAAAGATGAVVATPTGTMFHRPDCPVVTDRDDVRPIDPAANGLRPCKICNPLS